MCPNPNSQKFQKSTEDLVSQVINDNRHWRAFESNWVTHSVAHYLTAIDRLRNDQGYARVTDVASQLDISRGAASIVLSQLKDRGLVQEDPHRFLLLTNDGEQLAHRVETNFELLVRFFEDVLGIPKEIAKADACKMEHLLSAESSLALIQFLQSTFSQLDQANHLKPQVSAAMTNSHPTKRSRS